MKFKFSIIILIMFKYLKYLNYLKYLKYLKYLNYLKYLFSSLTGYNIIIAINMRGFIQNFF